MKNVEQQKNQADLAFAKVMEAIKEGRSVSYSRHDHTGDNGCGRHFTFSIGEVK